LVSTAWSSALGQIRGGQVIPIAVSSEVRLAEASNTPPSWKANCSPGDRWQSSWRRRIERK
jgi:tripartite-type tricarboxylate transporter receptor subunit TctC